MFLWSLAGAFVLCLLLFDLLLIADLLATRGAVTVAPTTGAPANRWLTGAEAEKASDLLDVKLPEGPNKNLGLLPTVWWSRDRYWGRPLMAAYARIDWLRDNAAALMLLVGTAVALSILCALLLSRARRLSNEVGLDVVTRLRRSLHRQRLRLGPEDLQDADGRHVLGLFTRQMDQIQEGLALWLSRLGRYPVEFLLLLAVALSIDWLVALQCLIPLAGCWYVLQWERNRFAKARRLAEDRTTGDLKLLAESLQKARIVRGYGMESFEHEQFQHHLDRFRQEALSVSRSERWSRRLRLLLVLACLAVVLFLLGSRALHAPEALPFSAALLLTATFALMYRPLEGLWNLRRHREQAALAADRVYRYLDRIPEVGQAVGAKFLQPLSKTLQFENVGYSLPNGRKLLDGLDVKLAAGRTYALVSIDPLESLAMAYLLPRFIEPHGGRILYDGEDIGWVTLESLRLETVFVGGADPFFTGTVLENISCRQGDYSFQQISEAAKQAHAHNFILKLQQGYETLLGEHGEQLDVGQAFRLGLARAILRDPAVMIIAEPEEKLDADTKSLLDDTYNRVCRDRTVLFLPTRLSTVRRCGHIVLLHRGRVEAIGTHSELLKSSGLYRHWDYIRFNEFRHEDKDVPVVPQAAASL